MDKNTWKFHMFSYKQHVKNYALSHHNCITLYIVILIQKTLKQDICFKSSVHEI